jgi:hypothetical protein
MEASRRAALNNELFGGASSAAEWERGERFLCPDDFSRSDSAQQQFKGNLLGFLGPRSGSWPHAPSFVRAAGQN